MSSDYSAGGGLELLVNSIPGGVFRCLFDSALTILEMNEGFPVMFGYTRQEIGTLLENSFWNMIDPRDRERTVEQIRLQMMSGTLKELEYRVLRKDGRVVWVLDKGDFVSRGDGPDTFCSMLLDITHSKQMQEELRLSLECHQIILDQTNDIIFEWDIQRDTFTFSPNWKKKFGYAPLTDNVLSGVVSGSHVHPEDRVAFSSLLHSILRGKRYAESELRLKMKDASYIWCRLRMTGQHNTAGKAVKAVGVIIDIDSDKRQAQQLRESAQRDALTKLYNKGTARKLIEEHLIKRGRNIICALLILDIDDFKLVNDTMGHLSGDAFLIEAAREIDRQFRSQDVVGRVGGDEFVIYMKNIPGERLALRKAEEIVRSFGSAAMRERLGCGAACSIGIAAAPQHGTTYQTLFNAADHALYQAKKLGKNRCLLYNAQEMEDSLTGAPGRIFSAVSEQIDSDEGGTISGKLVEYVFRVLYKSMDIEAAVSSILEIVGRHFDVSRAYIFENNTDGTYCCNTFEWCNQGVRPEIENLRRVSYEKDLGGSYLDNFNEDGIFYCRDISDLSPKQYAVLAPQGIKSMLQCAIRDSAGFKGYVGFDECRINRFWTQDQVDALTFISEVLSTFLLKQRAQSNALRTARALQNILDGQNAWTYVVRADSYELLYINKKALRLVPSAKVGMRCHETFFGRPMPCEKCPVNALEAGEMGSVMELYNPVLRVWSTVDASFIDWEGESAVVLSCRDITAYKHPEAASIQKD